MDILFISVFGSYNYALNDLTSDIDYKLVYIPTLDDLIKAKPTNEFIDIINGQVELISLPRFIREVKNFELPSFEIVNSQYIYINNDHKELFNLLKQTISLTIQNNKLYYIESVIEIMKRIYDRFVNNKFINYNGKKSYNIPRLRLLLDSVLIDNKYDLIVPESKRSIIRSYKTGIITKEQAIINCWNIINEVVELKSKYKNNELYNYELILDDLVNKAIESIFIHRSVDTKYERKTITDYGYIHDDDTITSKLSRRCRKKCDYKDMFTDLICFLLFCCVLIPIFMLIYLTIIN